MKRFIGVVLLVFLATGSSSAKIHSWKGVVHLSALPFIEGTGIYADVRILQTADQSGTRAGAITNLSLLAVQAGLGSTILFTDDDLPPLFRRMHRIVGMGILGSALWITIEGAIDKGVPAAARGSAAAHTALVAVPLLLFTF
jgi:hypothetical protein